MKPVEFDGINTVFGVGQPEYQPLPAERVGKPETGQVNTCWELDQEELKTVQETGKIYVSLLTFGKPLQPVFVSVVKPDVYDKA